MKYAIVYASSHGQTRQIAEFIKKNLLQSSHCKCNVELIEITSRNPNPRLSGDVDGVILGAPVYMQGFPRRLLRWACRHRCDLRQKSLNLFTVSLNAADQRPEAREADDRLLRKFIDSIGLVPNYIASFAGALNYPSYGWLQRRMMRKISKAAGGPTDLSQNFEMTPWNKVSEFAQAIACQDPKSDFLTARRFPRQAHLDFYMPEFEQSWHCEIRVHRGVSYAYSAACLGEFFGDSVLYKHPPYEIETGVIGQFWRPGFGVACVQPQLFRDFSEPRYTKMISQFLFIPIVGTHHTRIRYQMRMHSTSHRAAHKFRIYWRVLKPGFVLYIRNALRAVRREAESMPPMKAPPQYKNQESDGKYEQQNL